MIENFTESKENHQKDNYREIKFYIIVSSDVAWGIGEGSIPLETEK